MKKIRIGEQLLGEGEPCFIVAEAGVNHNGDINLAKKLIDAAKKAKADAVKFQIFKAEKLATKYAEKAKYQTKTTNENKSQLAMLKQLELNDEDFRELYNYAKKSNIVFLSSAFDKESVDLLNDLGVSAFKIASGEITNFPLLKYVAEKKKPVILSTGMSTLDEIGDALKVIRENGTKDIVLLHCVTSYPAKKEEINLRVIETLRQRFKLPIGFSDHTLGITIPIVAAALGAVLIEKHFTLDRNLLGPDHKASLEPDELKEMIKAIRDVEKALGDGIKKLTMDEKRIKKIARRSIVAIVDIPKGSVITKEMLDIKRPGTGIEPKCLDVVVGRKAKRNIKKDEILKWNFSIE
jgi:N-acetylneuraminate synthase/N,N'-diacetyllegionaminate synthase